MASIQIGQPSYGLLDTNMPAQAALAPIKGAGAVNALQQQVLQNEASQFEMQNALAEQEAYKRAAQGQGSVSQNLLGAGLGGKAAAYQKSTAEAQKLGLEGQLKQAELHREDLSALYGDPSDANFAAYLDKNKGRFTPQQVQQAVTQWQTAGTPEARQKMLLPQVLTMDKYVEHLDRQEQQKISRGHLGVAQANLALAQQNAASPEAQGLISKAILEGRLDPNKVNSRNRNVIAATLMADPNANLRQLGEEAAGGLAGARSIGTQEANVSMAASEARKMITLAEQYSSKVDRTQYPSINAISNAVSKGTGDPNIVQLDAALNSLVNVYARAINPKGVATVADKKHAREIIDRNYSAGQLSAAFQVMDQEMAAAQSAGKEARKVLRGGKTELSGEDKAAAEWAKANPNDPKAAKIRQHLGL